MLRYSTSSPTPTTDSRNCATSVTETSISRTRSPPCFSSSSKASSRYSMSNQSSNASKMNNKVRIYIRIPNFCLSLITMKLFYFCLQKFRKSDRSPSGSRNHSMVKLEYSSASQSKQHSEIAQETYSNQMGNIGQGYNSAAIAYLPSQYGITKSSGTN